jgi:hypothetical protein
MSCSYRVLGRNFSEMERYLALRKKPGPYLGPAIVNLS